MPIRSLAGAVVLRNIPFTIDEKKVLREMRIPKAGSLAELDSAALSRGIKKAIDLAYSLIRGQACYRTFRITEVRPDRIVIEGSETLLAGSNMVKLLADCDYATLMACHIGEALPARVEALSAENLAEAFYLERVGTWMADYMADAVDRVVESEIVKNGYERTFRYACGYGDWALSHQPDLLRLVEAEKIGLKTMPESHIMIPRMAVSAVIGWKRRAVPDRDLG